MLTPVRVHNSLAIASHEAPWARRDSMYGIKGCPSFISINCCFGVMWVTPLMVPLAAIGDLIELLHTVPIPEGVE